MVCFWRNKSYIFRHYATRRYRSLRQKNNSSLQHFYSPTSPVTIKHIDRKRHRNQFNINRELSNQQSKQTFFRSEIDQVKKYNPFSKSRKQKSGLASIQIILILIPVVLILGNILFVLNKSIVQIQRQKKIDQCLLKVMVKKCNLIEYISDINYKIKHLTHALTLIKLGKITSTVVPGLTGLLFITKTSEEEIKSLIKTMSKIQDLQSKSIPLANIALITCSLPDLKVLEKTNPNFRRNKDWESNFTQTEGTLIWKNIQYLSETLVYSKDLISKSFAHCKPKHYFTDFLGEKFTVSFQELKNMSKPLDNWL